MSRLNLDRPVNMLPMNLVSLTPAADSGDLAEAGSFDRHLDQVRQSMDEPSQRAEPRPRSGDDDQTSDNGPPVTETDEDTSPSAANVPADDQQTTSDEARSESQDDDGPSATEPSSSEADSDREGEPASDGKQEANTKDTDNSGELIDKQALVAEGPESGEGSAARDGKTNQTAQVDEAPNPTQPAASGELEEAAKTENGSAKADHGKAQIENNSGQQLPEGEIGSGNGKSGDSSAAVETSLQADGSRRNSQRRGNRKDAKNAAAVTSAEAQATQAPREADAALTRLESPGDAKAAGQAEIATQTGNSPTSSSSARAAEGETDQVNRVQPGDGSRRSSASQDPQKSGVNQADRVRFVQRVARAFEALGDRGGSVRLRLHPPELGSLRLEVTVRNGTMTARLEVENANARNMLLDNLPALRDRLAEQEIKIGRFDVDLSDRSADGTPEQPGDNQQPNDRRNDDSPGAGQNQELETEDASKTGSVTRPGEGSQLDVVI